MKSALKKVLSLMLVAMLLVTAIPFQASAAGGTIHLVGKYADDTVFFDEEVSIKEGTTTPYNLLTYKMTVPADAGDPIRWWSFEQKEVSADTTVNSGDTVTIKFENNAPAAGGEGNQGSEGGQGGEGNQGSQGGQGSGTNQGNEKTTITLNILLDDETEVHERVTGEPKNGEASIYNMLKHWTNYLDNYDFYRANNDRIGTVYEKDTVVTVEDGFVNVRLKSKTQEVQKINIVVKVNNSDNVVWEGSKAPSNGEYSLVSDLLSYCWNSDWDNAYSFDHAWSHVQGKNIAKNGKIYAGDTVYIMVNRGAEPDADVASDTVNVNFFFNDKTYSSGSYTYTGKAGKSVSIKTILNSWKKNWNNDYDFIRADITENGVTKKTSNVNATLMPGQTINIRLWNEGFEGDGYYDPDFNEKTAKEVFLYIHNWDIDKSTKYIKKVDLKNYTCVKVYDEVDMSDIHTIVNSFFTNKSGGKIPVSDMDGIYYTNRNTEIDRIQDINKYESVEGIQDMRMGDNDVILHVWIRNYKAKSSSTSNSTNPKTGDSVVMTVSALGITTSALAAAYYVSKKRMAK